MNEKLKIFSDSVVWIFRVMFTVFPGQVIQAGKVESKKK
jgi:hypothetical protein